MWQWKRDFKQISKYEFEGNKKVNKPCNWKLKLQSVRSKLIIDFETCYVHITIMGDIFILRPSLTSIFFIY